MKIFLQTAYFVVSARVDSDPVGKTSSSMADSWMTTTMHARTQIVDKVAPLGSERVNITSSTTISSVLEADEDKFLWDKDSVQTGV